MILSRMFYIAAQWKVAVEEETMVSNYTPNRASMGELWDVFCQHCEEMTAIKDTHESPDCEQ